MSDAPGKSVISLHRKLVSIPSISRDETQIADALEAWLIENGAGYGLTVWRLGNNVLASLGEGSNTLLLNTHLDVVPPSADHPHDPFDPVLEKGAVWGRGSVDAKASLSAMSQALVGAARSGWMYPGGRLLAAFTVCEETGGADNGLQHVLGEIDSPDAAVVGEPTMLVPCRAQKGLLILNLAARGRSAHAGRPELGDNAIIRMADTIRRIEALEFDRIHPLLGKVKCSVTEITGGQARNVIPDHCAITLDIRTTPAYSHDEIIGLIGRAVPQSEVTIHSKRLVPVETDEGARITRAACQASMRIGQQTPHLVHSPTSSGTDAPAVQGNTTTTGAAAVGSPTLSDWVFLDGVPAIKIGPGDSRLSHTGREHVSLYQLTSAVSCYRRIITNYFDMGNADE